MKITVQNARKDRAGKHNDRNFDVEKAPHIKKDKIKDNLYYTYDGSVEKRLNEVELQFYKEHFAKHLDVQNARYVEQRNVRKVKSIEEYAKASYTRPEDKILQIGDMEEHATPEQLWECAMAFKERFEALYGEQCKILDMALHVDEETPHVHIRRVWIARDENGEEYVSQSKALEQMGVKPPDPTLAIGRFNNPKMTITSTEKQMFADICLERGIEIETPTKNKARHLETREYKLQQEVKKHEKTLEKRIEKIESFLEMNPEIYRQFKSRVNNAKQMDLVDKYDEMFNIYEDAAQYIFTEPDVKTKLMKAEIELLKKKNEQMMDYLKEKGLDKEFVRTQDRSLEKEQTPGKK